VQDTAAALKLHSSMTNEQYLDAISAPRIDPSDKNGKKKPLTRRQMHAVDESEDSDDQAEDPHLTEETPGEGPVDARMDVDDGGSDTAHEGP
jgi:DNA-directed RNA polymerase-3 subunit RPC5